jgi:type I restriction enzyme R subunit
VRTAGSHPLLTYGREREGVDLSALRLTAYTIKNIGDARNNLSEGDPAKIYPTTETGSGSVQDKTKVALAELIARVNDLFEGDLTPGDKLVYVNDVIRGKLMESEKLIEQAVNNTKEQFANSPDLTSELINAVMDALTAHTAMSKQALESEKLREDMKGVLLGVGRLWEGLRERGARIE